MDNDSQEKDTASKMSTTYRRCRAAAYVCCLLAFGACFLLQAWDALTKYIGGAVTISVRRKVDPDLLFPTLALCPSGGFNATAMQEEGLPGEQWLTRGSEENFRTPLDSDEARRWYDVSTLSMDSIVGSSFFFDGRNGDRISLFRNGLAGNASAVHLRQVDSFDFGRCSVLSCLLPSRTLADYLRVSVSFPEGVHEVRLESFERGLELFGISLNYWQGPVREIVLTRGNNYFVELRKSSLTLRPDSTDGVQCSPDCTLRSRMGCFFRSSLEVLNATGDAGAVCRWPVVEPWSLLRGDSACRTRAAVNAAWGAVNAAKHKVTAGTSCPPCCTNVHFDYSVRTTPSSRATSSLLVLYFADLRAEFGEETLLYDFNNIVAAVGGSMGLFLGFSFLEFSVAIVDCIRKRNKPMIELMTMLL